MPLLDEIRCVARNASDAVILIHDFEVPGRPEFAAAGKASVTIEQVMRRIWPFYGVMFAVLMLVTYLPELSLWLPRLVLR